MTRQQPLPEAIEELTEDLDDGSLVALDEFADLVRGLGAQDPAGTDATARLMAAVRSPRQRYAPFIDRVADLFDLQTATAEELLARAAEGSAFKATALPGVRVLRVEAGPGAAGAQTRIVRFSPGMWFPRHGHRGPEALLLLEGGYRDTDGRDFRAGDVNLMQPGTEHGFRIDPDGPCIAASRLEGGLQFRSWLLRFIALFTREAD
jgi:quercetin dioxygenase-like cupin family protein